MLSERLLVWGHPLVLGLRGTSARKGIKEVSTLLGSQAA
jgi:hypothetical protein